METLMEKTVNEWPEMEDKEKVVVVDKVCKYWNTKGGGEAVQEAICWKLADT